MMLYILYKNDPKIVEARVVSSNTHPQQATPNNPMAILTGPVTDILVSVDGKTLPPFNNLPPQGMMATFSNDGMVISEDMGIIFNEMRSEREKHQRIMDSYEPSKEMVSKYDALFLAHDPSKQKEIAQAKEMADIRSQLESTQSQLSATNGKLDQMMSMFSAYLGTKPAKIKKEE